MVLPERLVLPFAGASIELRYQPETKADAERIAELLPEVTAPLNTWGALRTKVTVRLLPSHAALEREAHHRGYSWLRAWTRYDEVLLQTPSTWATDDAVLRELLTHELVHCLSFQRMGSTEAWRQTPLPFWFREGLATVTAKQGLRYPTLEDLAMYVRAHPEADLFAEAEQRSRDESQSMYGLAHHAVTFLLRRHGEPAVLELFSKMEQGQGFDDSFASAMGLSRSAFERDFLAYVRLRGFRGVGLPLKRRYQEP